IHISSTVKRHNLFFHRKRKPHELHSFPTRRSSDLLKTKCSLLPHRRCCPHHELYGIQGAGGQIGNSIDTRADLEGAGIVGEEERDRKSTRLNSSHVKTSYAVCCLKKKKRKNETRNR